jgi:hypothetical protein
MQVAITSPLISAQISRVSGIAAPVSVATAITNLGNNPNLSKIEISDSAAAINANMDALIAMGSKLSKLSITGPSNQLQLTATQYAAGSRTLAAINTNYSLKVTNATLDRLNTIVANRKVTTVNVEDTSANMSANFQALLNQPNKIQQISLIGPTSPIQLTGEVYKNQPSRDTLAKIQGGNYTLALRDVSVSVLKDFAYSDAKVTSIAIKDNGSNIGAELAKTVGSKLIDVAKVSSITQTDSNNAINVTDSKLQTLTSTLAKVVGAYSLAVSEVSVARASAAASTANVKSISLTDNASNLINANLNAGTLAKVSSRNVEDTADHIGTNFDDVRQLAKLSKIKLSDAENITLTTDQVNVKQDRSNKDLVAATKNMLAMVYGSNEAKGNYRLTITGVSVANIASTSKIANVYTVSVSDTVTNALGNLNALKNSEIDKIDLTGAPTDVSGSNLDKLNSLGAKLNSVATTAGTVNITYDQYSKAAATLAKINEGTNNKFIVSDASAAVAQQLKDDTRVSSFLVKDSAANIALNFAALNGAGAKLTKLQLSDTADIKLTAAQYGDATAMLAKFRQANGDLGGFKLQVSGVGAGNLVSLATSANWEKITKVSISDTTTSISNNWAELKTRKSILGDITLTNSTDIAITQAEYDLSASKEVLGKIKGMNNVLGNYTLDVSGVTAASASLMASNAKVNKLTVSDNSAQLTQNLASIADINASKLKGVTVDTLTDDIDISATNLALQKYITLLGKVDGLYQLNVTGVKASQAKLLSEQNSHVKHLTVEDTGTSISAKFGDLNDLKTANKLTAISLTDPDNPIFLSDTQYSNNTAAVLGDTLNGGNYKLSISGVTASDAVDASKEVNNDEHVISFSVKDTGDNIVSNLSALDAKVKLQSIVWTDTSTPLDITGEQYIDSIGTLSKINAGVYDAHITLLKAADTTAAENDSNISQFSVEDSAENLADNLTALQASAGNATPKIQAITQDGVGDVAISATAYASSLEAREMMALASTPITLTVSDVSANDVATIFADDQVSSFSVKDTAANIVSKLGDSDLGPNDLDTAVANITSISVSDSGILNLSGYQYADNTGAGMVLDKLGTYHAVVTNLAASHTADATSDANVDTFTIEDDAAGISANFAALVSAGTRLTTITQSDTDPIAISLSAFADDAENYADTLVKFTVKPSISLTA